MLLQWFHAARLCFVELVRGDRENVRMFGVPACVNRKDIVDRHVRDVDRQRMRCRTSDSNVAVTAIAKVVFESDQEHIDWIRKTGPKKTTCFDDFDICRWNAHLLRLAQPQRQLCFGSCIVRAKFFFDRITEPKFVGVLDCTQTGGRIGGKFDQAFLSNIIPKLCQRTGRFALDTTMAKVDGLVQLANR